jgi:hypothetical protein
MKLVPIYFPELIMDSDVITHLDGVELDSPIDAALFSDKHFTKDYVDLGKPSLITYVDLSQTYTLTVTRNNDVVVIEGCTHPHHRPKI